MGYSEVYLFNRTGASELPHNLHAFFPLSQTLHNLKSFPFQSPCPQPVTPSLLSFLRDFRQTSWLGISSFIFYFILSSVLHVLKITPWSF